MNLFFCVDMQNSICMQLIHASQARFFSQNRRAITSSVVLQTDYSNHLSKMIDKNHDSYTQHWLIKFAFALISFGRPFDIILGSDSGATKSVQPTLFCRLARWI